MTKATEATTFKMPRVFQEKLVDADYYLEPLSDGTWRVLNAEKKPLPGIIRRSLKHALLWGNAEAGWYSTVLGAGIATIERARRERSASS